MTAIDQIEALRLNLQARLDAAKTQDEHNRLGQFATPTALARDLLAYARSLLPPQTRVRFLDPALGTGSFYSALLHTFSPEQIADAAGYEIDPHYAHKALELWEDTPLKLHITESPQRSLPGAQPDRAGSIDRRGARLRRRAA